LLLLECERVEFTPGRRVMKTRLIIFVGVIALAIFNGLYSPRSFLIFALQGIWYPTALPAPLTLMFVLSGIISGLLHFLVSGVTAALFERTISNNQNYSLLVWFCAMLVPSVSTLHHMDWL
jgi:hypothetical protein